MLVTRPRSPQFSVRLSKNVLAAKLIRRAAVRQRHVLRTVNCTASRSRTCSRIAVPRMLLWQLQFIACAAYRCNDNILQIGDINVLFSTGTSYCCLQQTCGVVETFSDAFEPSTGRRFNCSADDALWSSAAWFDSSANGHYFSRIARPYEYAVERSVLSRVSQWWGECTADAFASAATAQLHRYWAESPDDLGAEAVDAFAQPWTGERVWAQPPPPHLMPQLAQLLRALLAGRDVVRRAALAVLGARHLPGGLLQARRARRARAPRVVAVHGLPRAAGRRRTVQAARYCEHLSAPKPSQRASADILLWRS